jgi:hypothetical protein
MKRLLTGSCYVSKRNKTSRNAGAKPSQMRTQNVPKKGNKTPTNVGAKLWGKGKKVV